MSGEKIIDTKGAPKRRSASGGDAVLHPQTPLTRAHTGDPLVAACNEMLVLLQLPLSVQAHHALLLRTHSHHAEHVVFLPPAAGSGSASYHPRDPRAHLAMNMALPSLACSPTSILAALVPSQRRPSSCVCSEWGDHDRAIPPHVGCHRLSPSIRCVAGRAGCCTPWLLHCKDFLHYAAAVPVRESSVHGEQGERVRGGGRQRWSKNAAELGHQLKNPPDRAAERSYCCAIRAYSERGGSG